MNRVTPGLFAMLHTPPILGRPFAAADGQAGADPVALIGYSVWKDRYALSPNVIGRVVRVNEKATTIVGVMPEGFRFPQAQDVWIPLVPSKQLEDRSSRSLQVFAYLKPGVTREPAVANLAAVSNRLSAQYPDTDKNLTAFVQTFHQRYNGGNIQVVFFSLLAAVGFVLMIACANVANMLLGRALGRQREISIRFALGATRWQIVRQLLLESLILSSLGGMAGLGLAAVGVHAFDLATKDVGKPYWILFQMDWQAFAYCAGMCILSGMLFGLAPALRSARADLNGALKDGNRTAGSRRGGYLTGGLVIGQFALTLVLLSGAGLFVRSFFDALSLNPAIPSTQILTARFHLPGSRYKDTNSRASASPRKSMPNFALCPASRTPPSRASFRKWARCAAASKSRGGRTIRSAGPKRRCSCSSPAFSPPSICRCSRDAISRRTTATKARRPPSSRVNSSFHFLAGNPKARSANASAPIWTRQ